MVFQAAGNEHARALAAADAPMSEDPASNIDGLFRVGATVMNGPGADDDAMAAFSAAGPVDASALGQDIPGGINEDGEIFDVKGTSFAIRDLNLCSWRSPF